MNHWRTRNTMSVTTACGRTMRTTHAFKDRYKEGYDAGYNACVLELRQLIGPEHGSFDAVLRQLKSNVQQTDIGSCGKGHTV